MESLRCVGKLACVTRHHTRAEIEAILAERESTGLTYAEMSARTGVAATTLSWWNWRRRREQRVKGQTQFVELVPLADTSTERSHIELVTRAGVSVRVPPGFDTETLRAVLAVVDRC